MMAHHPIPLDTLVERWAQIATDVQQGYTLTFDDYLNDVDLRHGIAKRLRVSAIDGLVAADLRTADDRFRAATTSSADCLWGAENARHESWTSEREWYYYRLPLRLPSDW